jgi:hypothetical protein
MQVHDMLRASWLVRLIAGGNTARLQNDAGKKFPHMCYLNLSLAVTACIPSFYITKFYILPAVCIYVFCTYLRTNSIKSLVFKNRDGKCLLRGTNWIFKYNGLRFILHPEDDCGHIESCQLALFRLP